MATSGLISIPLIFSAVVLQHKAWTPPNGLLTTPRRDYSAGFVEKTLFRSLTFITTGQKAIGWLVGGAEIAGILAKSLSSWRYPSGILKHLVPSRDYSKLGELDPWFFVGVGLVIAGAALRLFCFRTLGRMFSFEVFIQKDHKLVTSGPYSVVRHPSYSGGLLIYAGFLIWQIGPSSVTRQSEILNYWGGKALLYACIMWMATTVLGGVHRMYKEDDLLRKEFGDQWTQWASHTTKLFIPWVY
ncbi:hypothetical protein BDP27DRAFT_1330842 [Rhodocollybia butyracea]|uniref:Protein-S-isoprenylcysteine O-methyltransferase n=1 Tax=Rhodocollybia butyracea TaxID=206335 RepID=A0A9P5PN20_9AGAR|nr:hypothetical protein BDP27DRAFT_1330842 [Rhodocollybia butyracea]